jgi:hypothetical protein
VRRSRAVAEAAAAVRETRDRAEVAYGRVLEYGIVRSTSPLRVEMTDRNVTLYEDDVVIGRAGGIAALVEGDTLVLAPMANGDFAAVEVYDADGNNLVPPTGGGSGGDAFFPFVQSSPASTWTVAHGLGKYPSVTVVDSSGDVVWGDVHYVDANTVTLTFSGAFSGVAYLN